MTNLEWESKRTSGDLLLLLSLSCLALIVGLCVVGRLQFVFGRDQFGVQWFGRGIRNRSVLLLPLNSRGALLVALPGVPFRYRRSPHYEELDCLAWELRYRASRSPTPDPTGLLNRDRCSRTGDGRATR